MSKKTKRLLLVLELLVILALGTVLFLVHRQSQKEDAALNVESQTKRYQPSIRYQGNDYPLKRHMSTVLLMGTDNFSDDGKREDLNDLHRNRSLSDLLLILVFDHSAKTVTPYQICRDTMCDVSRVNTGGKPIAPLFMQITFAYTYGTGKEDSCRNTVETVENLLYGVPIDHYLSFTMDAVPLVNDLVGGVRVTLAHDIPALGQDYVKGATILLKGSSALRFVRYRDTALLDSNLTRMVNHRLYAEGFTEAARSAAQNNPDLAVSIFKKVSPFLCTDLSVNNIQDIVDQLVSYEIRPVVYFDGTYEMREGEDFPGYYVDEASLWSSVKSTFCE